MERLREPSTWVGLLTLAALLGGWAWAPEQIAAIATGISGVAGAVLVWVREGK
jgi:hypothetical protein